MILDHAGIKSRIVIRCGSYFVFQVAVSLPRGPMPRPLLRKPIDTGTLADIKLSIQETFYGLNTIVFRVKNLSLWTY